MEAPLYPFPGTKKLLLPCEVAQHYRVSERTVYRWIETGIIKGAFKVGPSVRIPRESAEMLAQSID
jgi:excisionase family DNA binding protein